jgi:hypothetical protein
MLEDGSKVCLTSVPNKDMIIVPLNINTGDEGDFQVTATGLASYSDYYKYLVDRNTGEQIDLSKTSTINISSTANRTIHTNYELVLSRTPISENTVVEANTVILTKDNTEQFVTMDNVPSENSTVIIYNSLGQVVVPATAMRQGERMPVVVPDNKQIYIVKMITAEGRAIHARVLPN